MRTYANGHLQGRWVVDSGWKTRPTSEAIPASFKETVSRLVQSTKICSVFGASPDQHLADGGDRDK